MYCGLHKFRKVDKLSGRAIGLCIVDYNRHVTIVNPGPAVYRSIICTEVIFNYFSEGFIFTLPRNTPIKVKENIKVVLLLPLIVFFYEIIFFF